MKNLQVRELVLMAFYITLFMVLDVISNAIPFFQMPNGGSWGISTIPLLMASYQFGWKKACSSACSPCCSCLSPVPCIPRT